MATVAFRLTCGSRTASTMAPKPARDCCRSMRMLARLWVWLADITRLSSSAPDAMARCAPLRLGTRAT
ncbi:hypothetical protein D3C76_1504980 [compost metagenome]